MSWGQREFAALLALGILLLGSGAVLAAEQKAHTAQAMGAQAPAPASPQGQAGPAAPVVPPIPSQAATQDAAPSPAPGAATTDTDTIHKIMEDNEAMLAGRGFTYDPAGRRDPFRSLVDALNSPSRGPRPRGIAGMLISEVDLVGIVQKGKSTIAFFNGSDNKGYFLRVGDTVYDGKIMNIDRRTGTVLFRQDVNDPRSIKPFRDVTKRLTPAEEDRL